MTDRWTNPSDGKRVAVRLSTGTEKAPEPARSDAQTTSISAGDKLVLAQTGDRDRFELRRGEEILGRVRQLSRSLELVMGDRKLTVTPEGKDVVLTEGTDQVARFEDRLLRADRIVLADGKTSLAFGGERLKSAGGAPLATFTPRNPNSGNRIVRIEIDDPHDAPTELIAFAAVVTLIKHLPGPSANRFGGSGPSAGDSTGVSTAGGP